MTIIISAIALILYYADIALNPTTECHEEPHQMCDHRYYATVGISYPHMWEFYYINSCIKDSFFKSAFQHGIEDNHLHGQYGPDSNVLCFYSYTV